MFETFLIKTAKMQANCLEVQQFMEFRAPMNTNNSIPHSELLEHICSQPTDQNKSPIDPPELDIDSSEYQPAMDMMRELLDKPVSTNDEKLQFMMLSSKLNSVETELRLNFDNAVQSALKQIIEVKNELDDFYDGATYLGNKLHKLKK